MKKGEVDAWDIANLGSCHVGKSFGDFFFPPPPFFLSEDRWHIHQIYRSDTTDCCPLTPMGTGNARYHSCCNHINEII